MSDLSAFPITRRWPAKHPDRLQLYSLPTPNGVKVSIMLEEIGLPYEPHLVDIGKNDQLDARVPVAQSERQDPRDHRSERAGRGAARPVRIRRDPALSRRQDRQAGAGRRGAPLRDHPVGVLPDGVHRPDVRPGRLLPQVRGPRDRRQAAARALSRRVEAPARRARDAARRPAMDHGRRLHDRRHLHARLGAQPGRLLRRRRPRRVRRPEARPGLAASAASRGPPCNAGWRSRNGRDAAGTRQRPIACHHRPDKVRSIWAQLSSALPDRTRSPGVTAEQRVGRRCGR